MHPFRFSVIVFSFLASTLWSQPIGNGKPSSEGYLVEAHLISPDSGLRDVNNRNGWGGMIGYEGGTEKFSCRLLLEASRIPTQINSSVNPSQKYTPLTWGGGVDGLYHFSQGNVNAYALAGIHIDYWEATVTYDSTITSPTDTTNASSSSSGHLGFRGGLGVNAGPFFVEARYRATVGNIRVPSDQVGSSGSWNAVEFGAGLHIHF